MLAEEWNERCHPLIVDNLAWCREVSGDQEFPHLFTDIEALNPSHTTHPDMCYTDKVNAIMGSWLQGSQKCQLCFDPLCSVPSCDFGISGLPCQDMSQAGYKQLRDGRTNGVYITHAKYNKKHRTPVFVVECTPESQLLKFIKTSN